MNQKVRKGIASALCMAMLSGVMFVKSVDEVEAAEDYIPMYRLYNPNSGEHFYTASDKEKTVLVSAGWNSEGFGWGAPSSGDPVYRLYNPNAGDHHYTMDEAEKNALVNLGWKYEGIGWYSDTSKAVPMYRQYNPNAKTGTHNYTSEKGENDALVGYGWKAEGVGWYAAVSKSDVKYTRAWETSDISGRYGVYLEPDELAYVFYDNDVRVANSTVSFYGRTYQTNANGQLDISTDAGMRACIEAVKINKDGQAHPYSNTVRWGPSYDCSSYVVTCYKNAGVDMGNASSTADLEKILLTKGFHLTTLGDVDSLKPGTICVYTSTSNPSADHASMYMGRGYADAGEYSFTGTWFTDIKPETGVQYSLLGDLVVSETSANPGNRMVYLVK